MPAKKMSKTKETENELMEHAKKDAKLAMDAARAGFLDAESRIEKVIRKDPVRAAMVATGLGTAIGTAIALAATRKKKKE